MKLNRTGSNWTELERNKINENWDIIEGSYSDVVGQITDEVVGHLIDSAKLIWKEPVDTVEDLPANAEVGETRMVREADPDGISYVYRYDGEEWEKIQEIDVTLVNEVDNRLRAQLADNREYADMSFSTLTTRRKGRVPIFSIISDDGSNADYNILRDIIIDKNIAVGLGIVTDWIGRTGSMDYEKIREMERIGCEILAHSHQHVNLTQLTEDEIDTDVRTNFNLLRQNGFNPRGFVYPFNAHNDKTIKVVQRYYNFAFSKVTGPNRGKNYPKIDNQAIRRVSLGSYFDGSEPEFPEDTSSLEYYKARVDEAIEYNNWLVFVMHPAVTDSIQFNYLIEVIDYIRSLGYDISSPTEGFNAFGNLIEVSGKGGKVTLDADGNFDSDKLKLVIDDGFNKRKSSDKITTFPMNKITLTPVTSNFALNEDLPEHKGGYLETYRITTEYYHNYQRYHPTAGTGRVYIRYADPNHQWLDWRLEVPTPPIIVEDIGKFDASDNYSIYRINTVTYTPYTNNSASSKGMPRAVAGVLKTERIGHDYWGVRQTYTTSKTAESAGNIHEFERYVDRNGNWTNWILTKGRLSGSSSERPYLETVIPGYCYIDTTLEKPIFYDGYKWIDSTGASV